MKRSSAVWLLVGFALVLVLASTAEAKRPCPPGYYVDGPRGCMPYGPGPVPPPPPGYYPPPPGYVPAPPCPPGTVWRRGACYPVRRGFGIYIGPPVYY